MWEEKEFNRENAFYANSIGHFTVLYLVTWPTNASKAAGDLALI